MAVELRSYQMLAVDGVRRAYLQGLKSPLLVLPTGGGKTVCFTYIASTAASKAKRVLILVHRVELLRQTSAALHLFGVSHGLINPKFTPDMQEPVQVASVQTLVRRLDKLPDPDLIIVDEAHHANAGTWQKIINAYPNARTLGVTATPCRGDGKGLGVDTGGFFDSLVLGPTVKELIEGGYLVKPRVYAPADKIDLSSIRSRAGDYAKDDLMDLLDKPSITGSAVDHYTKLAPGTPGVAFCINITHAEHVAADFRAAGFRAYSVDGNMDDDMRKRLLNGLADGSVDIICSCDLISEGTDIPAIGVAILLRPTKSLGLYLQQVGRALRPCAGKEYAIVLDHVGNTINHGMPDDDREWSLDGDPHRKRKKGPHEQTVRATQCSSCYAMFEPAPQCPMCGHIREIKPSEIKTVDGELVELTDEQATQIKQHKAREVSSARSLDALQEIERQRGYKKGWAKHIYNSRNKKNISNTI